MKPDKIDPYVTIRRQELEERQEQTQKRIGEIGTRINELRRHRREIARSLDDTESRPGSFDRSIHDASPHAQLAADHAAAEHLAVSRLHNLKAEQDGQDALAHRRSAERHRAEAARLMSAG
ncbi:hypothetical protein FL583_37295 [Cryptosporangium phraense]|uniref:Uncharacterized protein n=2 Tax=Cryptosporangium phraense TaxID=2593070 RepID=A0A545AF39_9ACTN|nr:hypothetical protein FL583_37295 [Cryptosporangium phraense]